MKSCQETSSREKRKEENMLSQSLNSSLSKLYWLLLSISMMLAAECAAIFVVLLLNTTIPALFGNYLLFLVVPPVAGLFIGLLCWWRLIEKPNSVSFKDGALCGVLSSIITHPVTWMIGALIAPNSRVWSNPLEIFLQVVAFSFYSLVFVGWITTPIGAGAGALLILLRRAFIQRKKEIAGGER